MREVIFHGKMPDPFLKEDGTRVTPEEWKTYKKELLAKIVDIEYGGMPPRPEYVRVERIGDNARALAGTYYRIHAGTKEKQVTFCLELNIPFDPNVVEDQYGPFQDNELYPVMLTGDGCYQDMESDTIDELNRRGYIAARFNRLEVCNDVYNSREGGIHDVYEGNYSDISAWAWAYMVCMDAFEQIPYVDETEVAITGHSRGGKTVMLAAAMDERIKYVCPNNSGCHGAVSHRCEVRNQGDENQITETLASMLVEFPTWMGEKLQAYKDRVQDLPYDMHYFGAMVAPRFYMQCEGMQDYWINPIGAWQNFMAVKECFRYLGCEDHAAAWFRPGYHRHKYPDFMEFLDFIERSKKNLPVREHLLINPYPEIEKNFDW